MPGPAVRLLGTFGARPDGSAAFVTGAVSRKGRRLLALLAVEGGRPVALERIVEALWPEGPPLRPADNVATLVSRLRAALGADCVAGGRSGYALGAEVSVDLHEAAGLVGRARAHPADGVALARRAVDLLGTGAVLVGEPDAPWVAVARAEGERLLRAARHALAEAALRAGDPRAAIEPAAAAAAADPLDEESHRLLISARHAAGERAGALAAYEALRAALADELGVDPSVRSRELHLAVLRDEASPPPAPPALTGRDAELAALVDAWSATTAGRPRAVLVAGEAGIGKTRLAEVLAQHVRACAARDLGRGASAQVLVARCYAAERSLFLQPFVDALGPVLGLLPADELAALAGPSAADLVALLPGLAPSLGSPPADRGSPDMEQRRAFDAVTRVLTGLEAAGPVLLLLDDLQNAGLASVELLHYLARHLAGARVLVVATVRAEEGEAALAALAPVAERIDLGPLDGGAVAHLAEAAGRPDLGPVILRRTRGHTLFVVETLRAVLDGDLTVPDTLQSAVLARLARAGAETEELLRAGAVLGASVDPAVVAAILGITPVVAVRRCEQAAAARLLVVAGRSYEFANDLVQEVLYTTTPEPVRVALHAQAADLLTRSPELVARHAEAAGDRPRAARALLLAGENAMRGHAVADADALFTRGLELADDPELVARARLARTWAREALGLFGAAEDDAHAALAAARAAGDRRVEMMALRALGGHPALARGVPVETCRARLLRALAIAESLGDRESEAGLQAWLAVVATNRLRFTEGLDRARRAVRCARAVGTDAALARALDGLKNAHAYLGELAPLAGVLDELAPLLSRLGDLELLQWAVFESAFPHIAVGEWDTATERVEEALAVNRRSGHPVHESWFVAHLGWIACRRGRLDEAEAHGRRAVVLAASLPHNWFLPVTTAMLAGTLIARGRTDEATRMLADARERLGPDGAEAHRLRCLAALAESGGSREVLDEADALLVAVDAPPGSAWLPGADTYLSVARAWGAHGEPGRAGAVLAPLRAAAAREGWTTVTERIAELDADVGTRTG